MHRNSHLLFQKHALGYFRPNHAVLEIGPDAIPSSFRTLAPKEVARWEYLELQHRPGIDWVAKTEYEFPIPDARFDVVFNANVIEHVRKIWTWLTELKRVTKPGGHIIIINPVSWPYHEYPIDCWRIYPEGMKALFDEVGLEFVFSTFESLECDESAWRIPGHSWPEARVRWMRRLHLPVQCAFDTISIARRPLT